MCQADASSLNSYPIVFFSSEEYTGFDIKLHYLTSTQKRECRPARKMMSGCQALRIDSKITEVCTHEL
jgi:hypothetical protein